VQGVYRPLADDGILRRIVGAAGAAPSIHNTQPWLVKVASDDVIELHGDPDRMLWVADPHGRALHLSCGAALFNIRLAIRMSGSKPLIWPLPNPSADPTLLASVQLAEGRQASLAEHELFEAIGLRHTSREPFAERLVPDSVLIDLEQEAGFEYAVLRMLSVRDTGTVLEIAQAASLVLADDFDHQVELAKWLGGSPAEGIPAAALGAQPDRRPAPVRDLGYGSPGAARPTASFERLPQLAVLSTARDEPADWLRAGQALQRILLTATRHGVAASFLYQPMELHDMEGTDSWWPWPEHPQIILRLGYGPPAVQTPRRPIEEILDRPGANSATRGPDRT
jgi:nitroreductase